MYHGKGLLPAGPDATTHVLTPGRLLRKGYWGVRRLEPQELLQAYDFGDSMVSHFVGHLPDLKGFVPLQSTAALIHCVFKQRSALFADNSVDAGGGVFLLPMIPRL